MSTTTTTKKITKAERFEAIRKILEARNETELVEFVNHEIELLDKKNKSKKPTKAQKENEAFGESVLNVVLNSEEKMSIEDIRKSNEEWKNYLPQKFAPYLNKYVLAGVLERIKEGRKTYYKAV